MANDNKTFIRYGKDMLLSAFVFTTAVLGIQNKSLKDKISGDQLGNQITVDSLNGVADSFDLANKYLKSDLELKDGLLKNCEEGSKELKAYSEKLEKSSAAKDSLLKEIKKKSTNKSLESGTISPFF